MQVKNGLPRRSTSVYPNIITVRMILIVQNTLDLPNQPVNSHNFIFPGLKESGKVPLGYRQYMAGVNREAVIKSKANSFSAIISFLPIVQKG